MALVMRGNVLLEVNEESVERMLDDGFDLVDENGTPIECSIPHDANKLRQLYTESLKTIKTLEAEIASLKAEQTTKTTAKKTAKKAE